jgi:hypothetical protein
LGAKSKDNGYGIFRRNSIQYKAHRIAYSLYVGEFINNDSRKSYHGLCVLHSCDNPTCCNPAHLFTGTHEDNMQDMIKKKRRNYQGEKNPAAKLTKDQVAKIRNYLAKGIPARQVARMYGVGATTIYHIQHNETWME